MNDLFQLGAVVAAAQAESAGFSLVNTFWQAEIFGKSIVVLLSFFSLWAWTVMIAKYLDLRRWRQLNAAFQRRLKNTASLAGAAVSPGLRQGGPYARLFCDAVEAARQHGSDQNPTVRMGLIENALQRGVGEECVRYEEKMVVLGSMVSGAPFIGLLGTVWGVMVAFGAMGTSGSTSLQSLAPGVASALLATVCGLLVAIPSVFGYNFLLTEVKMMITELENFASWVADRLELEFEMAKNSAAALPPAAVVVPADAGQPAAASPGAPPAAESPRDPAAAAAERYLRFEPSDGAGN